MKPEITIEDLEAFASHVASMDRFDWHWHHSLSMSREDWGDVELWVGGSLRFRDGIAGDHRMNPEWHVPGSIFGAVQRFIRHPLEPHQLNIYRSALKSARESQA